MMRSLPYNLASGTFIHNRSMEMTQQIKVLTAEDDIMDVPKLASNQEIIQIVREKHGKLNEGQPDEKDHIWVFYDQDDTPTLPSATVDMINRVLSRLACDQDAMELIIQLTSLGDMTVMEVLDRHDLTARQLVWLFGAYHGDYRALLSALQDESFLTALESYSDD